VPVVPPGRAIRIAGTLERFEEASEEDEERDTFSARTIGGWFE